MISSFFFPWVVAGRVFEFWFVMIFSMPFIPLFHLRVLAVPSSFQVDRSIHFFFYIVFFFFPLVGYDDFSLLVLCGFVGDDDDDDGSFSVAVVAVAFSVHTLVAFFVGFAVAAFVGRSSVGFLGYFFFFTWVHPSSSLSGWSLASNLGFSFVGGVIVVVIVVFVVDVVVGGVTVMVVF